MRKANKVLSLAVLLTLLVSCGETSQPQETTTVEGPTTSETSVPQVSYTSSTYMNPIYPDYSSGSQYKDELADPGFISDGEGNFYIFSTGTFTGGKCFKSTDMCEWEVYSNSIIAERPSWNDANAGANCYHWAPDVTKVGDKYIMTYSLSKWNGEATAAIGYATSDKAEGPYIDQGKLFTSAEIGIPNSIDPQIVINDDETVWLVWGSFKGIAMVQLNDDGCGLLNDDLDYAKRNLKMIVGTVGNSCCEGSYIIKKGEYWYYFGSKGSCCEKSSSTYAVIVGRSKSLFGPYRGSDGQKLSGSTPLCVWGGTADEKEVAGPGHNSIFVDDAGDYWLIYHAYTALDKFATRHLMLDKLEWDENDFPYVNGTKKKMPSYQEELDGPRFIEK